MTKFEQIGVERQYESVTAYESNRNFRISCNICCRKGLHINCDKCAIAVAHEAVQVVLNNNQDTSDDTAV